RSTCSRSSSLIGMTLTVEVFAEEREHHAVRPVAVTEVGLSLDALAHEAGTLGVSDRALVEAIDLQLEAMKAELDQQAMLEQPGRSVRDPPAARGRVHRQPFQARDLRSRVHGLESEPTGALAVDFDHETTELARLRHGAFDLGAKRIAIECSAAAEERLDLLVVEEAEEELEVIASRPANG